ncbi:MAG: hypothetical protein R3325_10120 [Thermoanaerobaculia bacterium]|nr:hypothetical protein [Thermoanaerobaculia bacterium]
MPKPKLFWPLIGGVGLFLVLLYLRGFAPLHALIASIAGSALVYWSLRAVENLSRLRK